MKTKILLTSFKTWLPHQESNSSDDLLVEIQKLNCLNDVSLFFLRNLPVNIELASRKTIAEIERIKPNVVMCCGMAEKRERLTIESNARHKNECLYTVIDLSKLNQKLKATEISHDAGRFVCEALYYELLKYIQVKSNNIDCIFVHVPILKSNNSSLILKDIVNIFTWFKTRTQQKS